MTGSGGAVRASLGLALVLGLAGCSPWAPDATPPAPPPGPSAAFDGRWLATIRATGSATGIDRSECDAEPRLTLEVRNGQFTLTQNHRQLAASAPTARDIATSTYQAQIAEDGTIYGLSNSNAVLRGRIRDGVMQGDIFGLLCYYSFNARRV